MSYCGDTYFIFRNIPFFSEGTDEFYTKNESISSEIKIPPEQAFENLVSRAIQKTEDTIKIISNKNKFKHPIWKQRIKNYRILIKKLRSLEYTPPVETGTISFVPSDGVFWDWSN